MADENSTLIGGTSTGVQPGDDFVIGFGNDDTTGNANLSASDDTFKSSESPSELAQSESRESSIISNESEDKNEESLNVASTGDDFSDFNIFDGDEQKSDTPSAQVQDKESQSEQESDPEVKVETASIKTSVDLVEETQIDNPQSEEPQIEIVEEKKFIPLDEGLGQNLNVDFDMGATIGTSGDYNPDSMKVSAQGEGNTLVENTIVEPDSNNVLDDPDFFNFGTKDESSLDSGNVANEYPDSSVAISSEKINENNTNDEEMILESEIKEPQNDQILENDFSFTESEGKSEKSGLSTEDTNSAPGGGTQLESIVNLDDENVTEKVEDDVENNFIDNTEIENFTTGSTQENPSIEDVPSVDLEKDIKDNNLEGEKDVLSENVEKLGNDSDFNFVAKQTEELNNNEIEMENIEEIIMKNVDDQDVAENIASDSFDLDSTKEIEQQVDTEDSIEEMEEASQFEEILPNENGLENDESSKSDLYIDNQSELNITSNSTEDKLLQDNNSTLEDESLKSEVVAENVDLEAPLGADPSQIEQKTMEVESAENNQSNNLITNNSEIDPKFEEVEVSDLSFDFPITVESNVDNEITETVAVEQTTSDNALNVSNETNIEPIETVSNTASDAVSNVENAADTQVDTGLSSEVKQLSDVNMASSVAETLTEETKPENDNSEVQTTLSLDQIMDAELLSSNQILTQPIASAPVTTTSTVSKPPKKNNKKLIAAVMSVGLVLVLGFVTVTAFPNLLSNNNSIGGEFSETGYVAPEPQLEDDPEITDEWGDEHGSAEKEGEFPQADPTIQFPEVEFPEPGIDPESVENLEGEMDDNPIPYIPEDFPEEPEEPEIEEVTFSEAMTVISSFKNQSEIYYNYGQEELDKLTIKYSSQIKYLCENYESKIVAGEGLDMESFEKFKSDVNLLISKINAHNGGSDAETYTVQEKSDSSDFEGKEEIRQYLYSK